MKMQERTRRGLGTVALLAGLSGSPELAAAVDLAAGDLVITDLNGNVNGDGLITRVRGTVQTPIPTSEPIRNPRGIAISPIGRLYITDGDTVDGVYRVDPATGERVTILEEGALNNPRGIAFDAAGNLLVVNRFPPEILRINPVTTLVTSVSQAGYFGLLFDIAIAANGDLFVTDEMGPLPRVYRVDPATGVQTIVASGGSLVRPQGIEIDAAGRLVIADATSKMIVRIDPAAYDQANPGANQAVVSSDPQLVGPEGLAIEANGNIVVADLGADKVFRVNPTTGAATVLLSTTSTANPYAIAVVRQIPICPGDPACEGDPDPDPTLGPTLEVDPGHPEIVAKAAELGSPLRIYKFVRNEIAYEPYYGSKKGALGTLWSGVGNDFDHASLLIALLRARGIQARYVVGVVDVDVDQLMQWAGVRDPAAAVGIFKLHYCLNRDTLAACGASPKRFEVVDDPQTPGVPASVRMEHAWVEARLSAADRGLALGGSASDWLALDSSWKQKQYSEPIDLPIGNEVVAGGCAPQDLCFDYDAYYASVDPRLASEIWEGQIQAWLAQQPAGVVPAGSTTADVVYDGPILPFEDEVLPLTLPFIPERVAPPLVATADLGTIADGLQRRFRLAVALCPGSCLSGATTIKSIAFVELVGKRLTFTFEPYTDASAWEIWFQNGGAVGYHEFCLANPATIGCDLLAVLRLDGEAVNVDTATLWDVASPAPPYLQIRRDFIPGFSPTNLAPFITGMNADAEAIYPLKFADSVAIGLDANQSSAAQVQKRIAALLASQNQFTFVSEGEGDANGNGIPGETLVDQGSPGITTCPYGGVFNTPALSECDVSVDVKAGEFVDSLLGELLHIASLRYLQRLREETDRVLSLDGYVSGFIPNVMLAKAGRSYTYLFNQPVGVEPGAPILDLRASTQPPVAVDGPAVPDPLRIRRELRLLGHVGSSLEHQVWEELIGSEFVSTVKGIQLIRERFPEQPLQTFTNATQASIDSALAGFGFDPISAATRSLLYSLANTSTETVITPIAAVSGDQPPTEVFISEQHSASVIGILMGVTVGGQLLGGSCQLGLCGSWLDELLTGYGLSNLIAARETTQGFGAVDVDASFTPPNDPSLTSAALAGDPVSMVSGNLHHTEQDILLPTDGPPFDLTRTYNSQVQTAGSLGFGWTHSYQMRIEPVQDEQEFVYLPSVIKDFKDQNKVEGPRSDTLDTKNAGTGNPEQIDWVALPAAFLNQVTVDSIDLEIAYNGTFNVRPQTGQAQIPVSSPNTGASANQTIRLKQANGNPYTNLAALLRVELDNFGGNQTLHLARLRIHYRGPAIRRVELAASGFTGWDAAVANLQDDDPSTCSAPTSRTATITYQAQTPSIVIAYEILAAIRRTPDTLNGNPEAQLYRGTTATNDAFILGPNVNATGTTERGYRARFMSKNTNSYGFVLTFDRDALNQNNPKKHRLCQIDYRILTFPEQLDFVSEDGSHERFSKIDGVWTGAAGVRDQIAVATSPAIGYTITRPDGRKLSFGRLAANGAFQLTLVSDPQGRSLGLTYGAGDLLAKVTWLNSPAPLPANREALSFTYAGSNLDFVEDWTGRRWDYTVDAAGDLIEARDPLETANGWPGVQYAYSAGETDSELNHNLTRITFPKDEDSIVGGDRWIAFSYFNSDRVASHVDSLNNRQTFLFNVPRQESQTTDPRGFTTVYRHDLKGNLLQRVDPDGATWSWAYDADRNVVSETDPLGRLRSFESFDARGNPARMIDRDGRTTDFTYDAASGAAKTVLDMRGNLRSVAFSSDGLPERVSAVVGGVPDVTLVTNAYDATSRVLRDTTQPYGDGTGRVAGARYDYFPGNRDVRSIERGSYTCNPTCTLSSVTAATQLTYDLLGRPLSESITRVTGPENSTPITLATQYQYDLRGRPLRVTRPDGTALVSAYDRNGNLEVEFLEEPRPSGPPLQHQRSEFRYDAGDRLVESEDAAGGITRFAYDPSGNRTAVTDPEGHVSRVEYDAMNRPVRAIDANGAVTTMEYDRLSQGIAVTDATGVRTTRAYDATGTLIALQLGNQPPATRKRCYSDDWQAQGCLSAVPTGGYDELLSDPNTNAMSFRFDELGRVVRHTDATPQQGLTQLSYDLRGQLRQVIDPEGATTTFDVDPLGRVTSATHPYTRVPGTFAPAPMLTQYDTTGNPIRITRPDGCVLFQDFDAMGQLLWRRTSTQDPSTCPADDRAIDDRYGYDARGLLVAAQNQHVGLIREYDALGRLTRETDDRFASSVAYQYDRASRLTAKVYPDGSLLHVATDAAGRPVGITDPTGDTTRYVYDPAGRRVQTRSTASAIRSDLAYDPLGRLDSIASQRADGSARPPVRYPAYDPAGNRLALQNELGTTSYAYDALHRLVTADPPGLPGAEDSIHYAYDRSGNRTFAGTQNGSGQWTPPYQTLSYETPATGGPSQRLKEVRDAGGSLLDAFVYDEIGRAHV